MKPEDIDKLANEIWNKTVVQEPEDVFLARFNKHTTPHTDENGKINIQDALPLLTSFAIMESMEKSFNMNVELLKKIFAKD